MLERLIWLWAPDGSAAGGTSQSGDAATGNNGGDAEDVKAQDAKSTTPAEGGGQKKASDGSETPEDRVTMPRQSFNKRLEQERRKAQRALLGELGFEDVDTPEGLERAQDELRELITFAREQRLASMSAEERAQAQVEEVRKKLNSAEQRAEQLQTERDRARQALRDYVVRSLITAHATTAEYPEDVFTWARQHMPEKVQAVLDAEQPLFDEEGALNKAAIDEEAVKEIVVACKKARPKYFRPEHPGSPSNQHAQPPHYDPKADQKRQAARRLVRF